MKRNASNPAIKAEALHRASQVGPAQAARELALNPSTVRMWMTRAKQAGLSPSASQPTPASSAEPGNWADRREQTAQGAADVAQSAIASARKALAAGKPGDAQRSMVSAGIAIDKLAQLEASVQRARESEGRLAETNAAQLVAVVELFFEAVGMPLSPSVRAVLRGLLEQAGAGATLSVSPADAQVAFADVRETIAAELRGEIEQELRARVEPDWQPERLGLPAPSDEASEAEPGELAAPRTVVRTVTEAEPEIADAEVVEYDDEVPQQYVHGYGEKLARQMWERDKRRNAERERKEAERPASLITTRPSAHHIDSPRIPSPGGGV